MRLSFPADIRFTGITFTDIRCNDHSCIQTLQLMQAAAAMRQLRHGRFSHVLWQTSWAGPCVRSMRMGRSMRTLPFWDLGLCCLLRCHTHICAVKSAIVHLCNHHILANCMHANKAVDTSHIAE